MRSALFSAAILAGIGSIGAAHAAGITSFGDSMDSRMPAAASFLGAKPMTLPVRPRGQVKGNPAASALGAAKRSLKPGGRRGSAGGPVRDMMQIVPDPGAGFTAPSGKAAAAAGNSPQAYGDAGIPFSTSRVELNSKRADVTKLYPYRAAGRLAFTTPEGRATCSAALVDKGIIITAAHCVAEFGGARYTGFSFIPGYYKGQGAYGAFGASRVYLKTSYLNGTDNCAVSGVECENDVALIVMKRNADLKYPGQLAGWFGLAWDGYGFTPEGQSHVTQLGYPGSLDGGRQMIRNDSIAYAADGSAYNTVIGSSMDGGSSGGPWVINLGVQPDYAISAGYEADPNMIIGVTSWGFSDDDEMDEQGASPLLSSNVGELLSAACADYPSACSPQ